MGEIGTDSERCLSGAAQQSVPTQAVVGGEIYLAKDVEAVSVAELWLREPQERRRTSVWGPPVCHHLSSPNKAVPNLVHCVYVRRRGAGYLPANE